MKKVLPFIPAALFPYVPILLIMMQANISIVLLVTGIALAVSALCTLLNLVCSVKYEYDAETLLLLSMVTKLVHIPAFAVLFFFGFAGLLMIHFLAITLIIFAFDCVVIFLTGTLALSAAIRGANEGRMKKYEAVLYGICSYMFCVDVIVACIAYVIIRKRGKSN